MFGKRGQVADDIKSLKGTREFLKSEVARMKGDIENLQRRLDTTFHFFEIRVDQIYRSLSEGGVINAAAEQSAASYQLPTNPEWEKLIFAATSRYIEPGLIPSPITLSGMRIDTRHAVERLYYTEIDGNFTGIAVFGPYRRLHVGAYSIGLALDAIDTSGRIALYLEVFTVENGKEIMVAGRSIDSARDTVLPFNWGFELTDCEVQFRVHQRMGDAVRLYGFELVRHSAGHDHSLETAS